MPLEPYKRGKVWWVKGRIEYNGLPISDYYRCSTGASDEAGARDWIAHEIQLQIRRHLVGEEASLTFADAVLLYRAKPAEAKFLMKLVPHLGDTLLADIAPETVRELCPVIYPYASTDTWRRQVLTPVSAVINNAHDKGKCSPIRIKGFSSQERINQDKFRGKLSREPRKPGSWEWIRAVQPHSNDYVAAGLEFMFETGCRIGQMVAIRPRDLDLSNLRVRLIAQKGHPEQWVSISVEMVALLANLKPRRPHDRKRGRRLQARVFGYGDRSGFTASLRKACREAQVAYLTPHEAGRHGFYTELRVRQGVDSLTAAKAGRWSNAALPDARYGHVEGSDGDMRAKIRTSSVQSHSENPVTPMKRNKK